MATKHLLRITTSGLVLILLIGTFIEDFAQTKKKRPVYYSVYANHVMRVRLNDELDSEKARIGDTFTSTLVDPLYSKNGVLVAPQGSTVNGRVINVQRAKKKGEPAVLDVQFTSLSLPNGRQRAINGSLTDLETSTGNSDNEGSVTAHKTQSSKSEIYWRRCCGGRSNRSHRRWWQGTRHWSRCRRIDRCGHRTCKEGS
jgi:hypothetical protein